MSTTTMSTIPASDAAFSIDAGDLTRRTGTSRADALSEMKALLDWPGLYLLAGAIEQLHAAAAEKEPKRRRGRRSSYPTAILLFAAYSARITGSLASALSLVRNPTVWRHELGPVWAEREETQGIPFPAISPNRDQVRHFTQRLVANRAWEDRLQQVFQQAALLQARLMGNLDPEAPVDWTRPSLANTIIGDGMVPKPLSGVIPELDFATGEIYYPKSASTKIGPRLAPGSDLRADGKAHLRGLNMVSLLTCTPYGWVVLGTGTAWGAEQWAALDLFDSVVSRANGGVHNLLWDRVYNRWLLDYVLARHRVRVFNKSTGENREKSEIPADTEVGRQRHVADAQLEMVNSDFRYEVRLRDHLDQEAEEPSKPAKAALFTAWRMSDLYEMFYSGAPQPLGLSLYRATSASTVTGSRNQANRKKMEVVRSRFRRYGTETHPTGQGSCSHELYVDDGALHSVEADPDRGCLVKVATATCTSSQPRRRPGGRWGTTERWLMPCPHGDFEITTEWDPPHHRRTPDTEKPRDERDPAQLALTDLRPISRSQAQQFADIANHRNNAESWNNWYERRLPNYGRAASLSAEGQAFDYLAGACVRNAITWARWHAAD
jgi:hypothetical protein